MALLQEILLDEKKKCQQPPFYPFIFSSNSIPFSLSSSLPLNHLEDLIAANPLPPLHGIVAEYLGFRVSFRHRRIIKNYTTFGRRIISANHNQPTNHRSTMNGPDRGNNPHSLHPNPLKPLSLPSSSLARRLAPSLFSSYPHYP